MYLHSSAAGVYPIGGRVRLPAHRREQLPRRLTLLALAAPPLILMDPSLLESAAGGALDDPDAGVRESARQLLAAVRREADPAADRVDSGGGGV